MDCGGIAVFIRDTAITPKELEISVKLAIATGSPITNSEAISANFNVSLPIDGSNKPVKHVTNKPNGTRRSPVNAD